MRRAVLVLVLALALALSVGRAADDAEPAWQALRAGGHVALLRHAAARGGRSAGFSPRRLRDAADALGRGQDAGAADRRSVPPAKPLADGGVEVIGRIAPP
jgi:hypothetical protein